jgi:RNA polymerase sigma-70 factor, ECF subfamily
MPGILPMPDDADDDAQLLLRIRRGDRTSLDVLFRRHRTTAFRVAYRLLGNETDALDAVQEGFTNALAHLNNFRGGSSFKTWLLRIVSNASLDMGRHRRRPDSRFLAVPADEPLNLSTDQDGPDSGIERDDLRKRLAEALAAIPEIQRQTFVLHIDGDLTYQEVADTLGISVGTVMSRIFYARKRLQSLLADYVCP